MCLISVFCFLFLVWINESKSEGVRESKRERERERERERMRERIISNLKVQGLISVTSDWVRHFEDYIH